jgi:hypothetical protein
MAAAGTSNDDRVPNVMLSPIARNRVAPSGPVVADGGAGADPDPSGAGSSWVLEDDPSVACPSGSLADVGDGAVGLLEHAAVNVRRMAASS